MRIKIDLDNTTAALQRAIVEFYNRVHTNPISLDEFRSYNTKPRVDWISVVHAFYRDENLWVDTVQPYPGALDVIEHLAAWHDVVICSAYRRPEMDTTPRKRRWLEKHRPSLVPLFQGCLEGTKAKVRADLVIDDAPDVFGQEQVTNPNACLIVVDQPYNREVQADVRIHNVSTRGWHTIATLLGG